MRTNYVVNVFKRRLLTGSVLPQLTVDPKFQQTLQCRREPFPTAWLIFNDAKYIICYIWMIITLIYMYNVSFIYLQYLQFNDSPPPPGHVILQCCHRICWWTMKRRRELTSQWTNLYTINMKIFKHSSFLICNATKVSPSAPNRSWPSYKE